MLQAIDPRIEQACFLHYFTHKVGLKKRMSGFYSLPAVGAEAGIKSQESGVKSQESGAGKGRCWMLDTG